jgi:hypothetical protein
VAVAVRLDQLAETEAMNLAALIVAIVAAGMAVVSTWYARRSVEEARRSREVAEAAEHRAATPGIAVRLGADIGGDGRELLVTSLDRDIESGVVTLVPGHTPSVVGLSDRPAGLPAGTMGTSANLPAIVAGSTVPLGIWITDPEQVAGESVKLRCEVKIGSATWTVVRDITFPIYPFAIR